MWGILNLAISTLNSDSVIRKNLLAKIVLTMFKYCTFFGFWVSCFVSGILNLAILTSNLDSVTQKNSFGLTFLWQCSSIAHFLDSRWSVLYRTLRIWQFCIPGQPFLYQKFWIWQFWLNSDSFTQKKTPSVLMLSTILKYYSFWIFDPPYCTSHFEFLL